MDTYLHMVQHTIGVQVGVQAPRGQVQLAQRAPTAQGTETEGLSAVRPLGQYQSVP